MSLTAHDSRALTRTECTSLLRTVAFGRLVFTEGALPAAIPVCFVLDPAGIVLRTAAEGAIARLAVGSVVALQADDIDTTRRTGWSVTVVGEARTSQDPLELARLHALPLQPWVAGERNTIVVVEIGIVSGRRIGGPAAVSAPAAQEPDTW